jgi:AAA ATPase domain
MEVISFITESSCWTSRRQHARLAFTTVASRAEHVKRGQFEGHRRYGALLDVPVDDATWQKLDPGQRRQRTLDAVKRLLLREACEQPVLLIFEDLHWIDSETQALLDGLVDSLGSARVLLLVNYRPEYQHARSGKTYYTQMRLDALPAGSAAELLEALLGQDPGLGPLKQLLVKRGNPFFLEETIRTLVETKALAGEPAHGQVRAGPAAPAYRHHDVPRDGHAALAGAGGGGDGGIGMMWWAAATPSRRRSYEGCQPRGLR